MAYNSKELKVKSTAKKLAEPKDAIVSQDGQYKYAGQITKILGNQSGTPITMKGVSNYLKGVDNLGNTQMMYPGAEYFFPGSSVTEFPIKRQLGGPTPPEDWEAFLAYNVTAPENRQAREDWTYGDSNNYDHYGMWEALGKPSNFEEAKKNNPDWTLNEDDDSYHGFSVNPNTGVWLKNYQAGEGVAPGSTGWMEANQHYLNPESYNNFDLVYDPELQRMRYVPKQKRGGSIPIGLIYPTQDLSKKKRKVINSLKTAIAKGEYIEPIKVKEAKKGYEIEDGHHRYLAYKEMGVHNIPIAQKGKQKDSGTYVKVRTPEGVKTLNTDSEEYRKYYGQGTDNMLAVNYDGTFQGKDLEEATVTAVDPMREKYPYWNYLNDEQKRFINDSGSIGRGIRAQATHGYGINGNPTFSESLGNTLKQGVKEYGNALFEVTGIPSAYRIGSDPLGTLEGLYQTGADMVASPYAVYDKWLGSGKGFEGVNPLTGEYYGEGLDELGDVASILPGIGIAGKALKGSKALKVLKQTPGKSIDFINQAAGKVLKGRANKAAIKEGNEWLKAWISHPATQAKINKDLVKKTKNRLKDAFPLLEDQRIQLGKEQAKNFIPGSNEYPLRTQFKEFFDSNKEPIHLDNFGVSYLHGMDPIKRYYIEPFSKYKGDSKYYGSWISRDPTVPSKKRTSTTIHEGTHDWVSDYLLENSGQKDFIYGQLDPEHVKLTKKWNDLRNQGIDPSKHMTPKEEGIAYLADPTEVHARVMELRKHFRLKPDVEVDPDMAQAIINNMDEAPINKGFKKIIGNDPARLANLMNRLWMAPAAVVGSAATLGALQEKKYGGGFSYQPGGIVYGSPEYNEAYEEGTIVTKGYDGVLQGKDLPEATVTSTATDAVLTPEQLAYVLETSPSVDRNSFRPAYGEEDIDPGVGYGTPQWQRSGSQRYPNWDGLTKEEKRLITDSGPIGNNIRSKAGFGKDYYKVNEDESFSNNLLGLGRLIYETSPLSAIQRRVSDPMGTLEGLLQTGADILGSGIAIGDYYLGSGQGFSGVNPLTGKNYGEGLDEVLDIVDILPVGKIIKTINKATDAKNLVKSIATADNTIREEGKKFVNRLKSPEGQKRLKNQFAKADPTLNDEQLDWLVQTRITELDVATEYNKARALASMSEGDPKILYNKSMVERFMPKENAHFSTDQIYDIQNVNNRQVGDVFPQYYPHNIKNNVNQFGNFLSPYFKPGSIALGPGLETNKGVVRHEGAHAIQAGGKMPIDYDLLEMMKSKNLADRAWRAALTFTPQLKGDLNYFENAGGRRVKDEAYPFQEELRSRLLNRGIIKDDYETITARTLAKARLDALTQLSSTGKNSKEGTRLLKFTPPWKYKELARLMNEASGLVPITIGAGVLGAEALQEEKYGGGFSYQPGGIVYGSPEYNKAYEEGTIASKGYDGVFNMNLPDAEAMAEKYAVTAKHPMSEKYPYWNYLNDEEKKYINDSGSIGRGVRAQATSGYGINNNPTFAKSASDFAMGSLTAGPVSFGKVLQTPQSLVVEGVEALRGNPYNFSDAVNIDPYSDTQRSPSDTFLKDAPGWVGFAGDVILDPTNLLGASFIKSPFKTISSQAFRPGKLTLAGKNIADLTANQVKNINKVKRFEDAIDIYQAGEKQLNDATGESGFRSNVPEKKYGGGFKDLNFNEEDYMKKGGSKKLKINSKFTNKNIQSSINELFKRNETLFGPKGKKYYKPFAEGGSTNNTNMKKLTDKEIAFPQQPTAAEFYARGFVPNSPVGFYRQGGMSPAEAYPQQPPADIFFSGYPFQPQYMRGGMTNGIAFPQQPTAEYFFSGFPWESKYETGGSSSSAPQDMNSIDAQIANKKNNLLKFFNSNAMNAIAREEAQKVKQQMMPRIKNYFNQGGYFDQAKPVYERNPYTQKKMNYYQTMADDSMAGLKSGIPQLGLNIAKSLGNVFDKPQEQIVSDQYMGTGPNVSTETPYEGTEVNVNPSAGNFDWNSPGGFGINKYGGYNKYAPGGEWTWADEWEQKDKQSKLRSALEEKLGVALNKDMSYDDLVAMGTKEGIIKMSDINQGTQNGNLYPVSRRGIGSDGYGGYRYNIKVRGNSSNPIFSNINQRTGTGTENSNMNNLTPEQEAELRKKYEDMGYTYKHVKREGLLRPLLGIPGPRVEKLIIKKNRGIGDNLFSKLRNQKNKDTKNTNNNSTDVSSESVDVGPPYRVNPNAQNTYNDFANIGSESVDRNAYFQDRINQDIQRMESNPYFPEARPESMIPYAEQLLEEKYGELSPVRNIVSPVQNVVSPTTQGQVAPLDFYVNPSLEQAAEENAVMPNQKYGGGFNSQGLRRFFPGGVNRADKMVVTQRGPGIFDPYATEGIMQGFTGLLENSQLRKASQAALAGLQGADATFVKDQPYDLGKNTINEHRFDPYREGAKNIGVQSYMDTNLNQDLTYGKYGGQGGDDDYLYLDDDQINNFLAMGGTLEIFE